MRLINSMLTAVTIMATATSVAYAAQDQKVEPGVYEIESVARPGKVLSFPEKSPGLILVLDDKNLAYQRWTVTIPKDDDLGKVELMQLVASEELCITTFSSGPHSPPNMFRCDAPLIQPLRRWSVKGGMPSVRLENDGVNWGDGQARCLTSAPLKDDLVKVALRVDVCRDDEKGQVWNLRRIR